MNKRQPWTNARRLEVVRLYREGLNQDEIAARLGTGQGKVSAALAAMNEPTRDGRMTTERCAGPRNRAWNGGKTIDKNGYVLIWSPDHPHRNNGGYVREHRLAMEKKLGRYLLPTEVVHHPGKDHGDNDPEKLELFTSNADHLRHELAGQVPKWSAAGKRRIIEAARKPRKKRALKVQPT